VPAFDGAGVPSIGFIGQCAVIITVMSLQRFGLELPASVKGKLAELGMVPDFAGRGEDPSFFHELVDMGGPIRITWCISTTSQRSENLAGASKMHLHSTGRQLTLRRKAEAHRGRARGSSDEEDVSTVRHPPSAHVERDSRDRRVGRGQMCLGAQFDGRTRI
jgi:hypothetical protein